MFIYIDTYIYIYINICIFLLCGCVIPRDSVGNGAASQERHGRAPTVPQRARRRREQDVAQDEEDEVLAGVPPARKGALQQNARRPNAKMTSEVRVSESNSMNLSRH